MDDASCDQVFRGPSPLIHSINGPANKYHVANLQIKKYITLPTKPTYPSGNATACAPSGRGFELAMEQFFACANKPARFKTIFGLFVDRPGHLVWTRAALIWCGPLPTDWPSYHPGLLCVQQMFVNCCSKKKRPTLSNAKLCGAGPRLLILICDEYV